MRGCDCPMQTWHLRRSRSCPRQALIQLRAARSESRGSLAGERLRRAIRNADLRLTSIVAVVIHVPLLGYVHSNPGSWLDGAWQISAVLVGLVTTLIIFLLQAA